MVVHTVKNGSNKSGEKIKVSVRLGAALLAQAARATNATGLTRTALIEHGLELILAHADSVRNPPTGSPVESPAPMPGRATPPRRSVAPLQNTGATFSDGGER